MAGNRNLILAGVAAGGTGGTDLSWWAPLGTTMPTSATTALDAAFVSAGLISEDGLTKAAEEESNAIRAFGVTGPVRTVTTSSSMTFQLTFLESNVVSLAVAHRLALGTLTADATGEIALTEGPARSQQYAAVFDLVDGTNRIRAACPSVEVTNRADETWQPGQAIGHGVTVTAYPGSDGVAIQWFYLLSDLASAS